MATALVWANKKESKNSFARTWTSYRTLLRYMIWRTVGQKHIADASQMFLSNDFSLTLKLLVQIACIFSIKYFCHRNASPKAILNRFLKRPQFQQDQDSKLPVQVYGLTDLLPTPWYSGHVFPRGRQWPQKIAGSKPRKHSVANESLLWSFSPPAFPFASNKSTCYIIFVTHHVTPVRFGILKG